MMDFSQQVNGLLSFHGLISLLTLSVLEIVLGIDNIIFIAIVAGKITDRQQQRRARVIGLMLAMVMRIILLYAIAFLAHLRDPFYVMSYAPFLSISKPEIFLLSFSIRDVVLFAGGIFLLYKTTIEIHNKMIGEQEVTENKAMHTVNAVIMQIVLIDILFSFDTILTAIGLVNNLLVMILAVIIGMIIMITFSGKVSDFIHRSPAINMLALVFLIIIGMLLILQAFHQEVEKEYVYFAMGFVFAVELIHMRLQKKKSKERQE